MTTRSLRTSTMALGVAAALFTAPAESQAIFHWFKRCCGAPAVATVPVAPTYAAYGVDPCGCQPQQVSYVPQTCYRTQYVNVPTTVYRPVTVADPCTGCPVTTLRPMVAYVPQARQVPYVSYRIVYSNPAAVAYPAVNTAGYAAPAGCSGCGSAAPAYSPTYSPTYSSGSAAQPYYNGAATRPSTVGVPSADSSAPVKTFQNGADSGPTDENRMKPIPDPEINKDSRRGPASAPQLIAPDDSRTTSRPVRRAVHVESSDERLVSKASQTQPSAQRAKSAWRQSSR